MRTSSVASTLLLACALFSVAACGHSASTSASLATTTAATSTVAATAASRPAVPNAPQACHEMSATLDQLQLIANDTGDKTWTRKRAAEQMITQMQTSDEWKQMPAAEQTKTVAAIRAAATGC